MRLTQIKASSKGFTLVELIVVITILAILGTIAFISFGSYSNQARDSKRVSDLTNLSKTVNIGMTKGNDIMSYIANDTSSGSAIIGGATGTTTNYKAGDINYVAMGVNADDFKDPKSGVSYKIGYSTSAGGVFQLASYKEETNLAYVIGNYDPRSADSDSSFTVVEDGTKTFKLSSSDAGKIKKGDSLNVSGSSITVGSISSDLLTITYSETDGSFSGATGKLSINETGLIFNGLEEVTNNGSNLPY